MRWGFANDRVRIIVLFASFAAVFFAGCLNPVAEPDRPAAEPKVLVIRIAGEAPANRTALPLTPNPDQYAISVTRATDTLGRKIFDKGLDSYPVELTKAPAAGDVVSVEGLDGNEVKIAGGNHVLTESDISGDAVSITLCPLTEGTGDVDLSVSFERNGEEGEVTVVELSLYKSLADYRKNTVIDTYGARYRKDESYGTGTAFTESDSKTIIPIKYDDLSWGNYVVMIEFFRGPADSLIKVSRLVQTIIVRGNLTTNTWDNGGSNVLAWNAFASSNANLAGTAGIKIDRKPIAGYDPETLTYNLYEATTSVPAGKTLTVTGGEPGQTIDVRLNNDEKEAPLVSGKEYTLGELEELGTGFPGLTNTLVITVTAPDGFTEKSYTVNISGKEIIAFYFTIDERHYGVGTDDIPLVNGSGRISDTGFVITIPYGTDISTLTPNIIHSGKSTSLKEGTTWSSSPGPYFYEVKAVDGTSREYRVGIEKFKNTAKELTAFRITGPVNAEGSINEDTKTVTVNVPYGTDVTAMTANVTVSPNASIRPDPEGGLNYTDPVTYTVTAEDGTTQEYTVTVNVPKIASVTAVTGNFLSSDGFKQTEGSVSGADIESKITSVTGTDSRGTPITLKAADYSVDDITGATAGATATAILRVQAAKTSTGADITWDFTVYVKKDAKAITDFYFTIGSKDYGVKTGAAPESGSGSISGNNITITVPRETVLTNMTATVSHTGASINPNPAEARNYTSPVPYTVTAEDGTTQDYTVTVKVYTITISSIIVKGLDMLKISGGSESSVTGGAPITFTISGDNVSVADNGWYIDINGSAKTKTGSTGNTVTFNAPEASGFYNVNVFATVDDVDYSGSFGMIVE